MSKKEPIVIYKKDMDKLHKKGKVTIDDMLLVYQTDPELPTKKDTEEEIEEVELWDWIKSKIKCCITIPSSGKLSPCCPLSEKDVEGKSPKKIEKMLKSYLKKNSLSKNSEEELDELVGYDGSINSSAIPDGWENNKTISATKTTDATVHMSRQGPGIAGGAMGLARRYWLEETDSLEEEDMSVVLGFDETMHMNGDETIEYFEDEHDMDEDEAKERSQSMGKNEGSGDFQRLVEDDDVIKMLEIILNKNDEDLTVQSHNNIEDSMLDRKIRHFVKYIKNKGYSMDNIVNRLKNE